MEKIVKICKIHGDLTIDKIYTCRQKNKNGDFYIVCAMCRKMSKDKWKKKNTSRMTEYKKRWLLKNPQIRKNLKRRSALSNAKNLSDGYVRRLLTRQGMPQELIEVKRAHVSLERALKAEKLRSAKEKNVGNN